MKHNSQTLCAVRRLHAEIGGKIIDSRKNANRLREDKRHVAAVIRMFSPEYDVKAIAARRTYKANPWFKRGTLFRSAIDILRRTVRVVNRMLATKGIASRRIDQIRSMQSAIWLPCRNARVRD